MVQRLKHGPPHFIRIADAASRRVDAYGEEGAPKSAAGVRTVPLSNQLVAMLKAWKLKSKFKKLDDLVFPNGEGTTSGMTI
jgi:integrase